MRNFKYIYYFLFIIIFTSAKSEENNLVFHGAYTFETFPGQKSCAVYVSIFNNTNKDFTINIESSDVSEKAEIHKMEKKDNIIKMKKIEKINIQAKDQVFFQPGGTHIMLMNLKKELEDGSSFFINFLINNKKIQRIKVLVLNKKLRENFIE